MGFIGPRGWKQRPPYVRKGFVSKPANGGTVASGWPGPRGRAKDRWQRSIQQNLGFATNHVKRLNDREVAPLRDALAAFNRRHEGLTGTASIRLEDLLTQLVMGRLFAYRLPDGRTIYTANSRYDISRRFDWLEPRVGSILTRTEVGWLPTVPCEEGARCMLLPSIPMPDCCPPASVAPNEV